MFAKYLKEDIPNSQKESLKKFISNCKGNLDLNKKIKNYQETSSLSKEKSSALKLLVDFTYKTQDLITYKRIKKKLDHLQPRLFKNKPIIPSKKLTLREIALLEKSHYLLKLLKKLDNLGLLQHDCELVASKASISKIQKIWKKISSEIKKEFQYQGGDLAMDRSLDFKSYLGKELRKEVKLQNLWLRSDEFHASLINVSEGKKKGKKLFHVAHLQPEGYKHVNLGMGKILYTNVYRIIFSKLVNSDARKKINDYLIKTDRKDKNWEEFIQEHYKKALNEILKDDEKFKKIKNTKTRRFLSIIPNHFTFTPNDFSNYSFRDKKDLICSEFIAILIGRAINKSNQNIKKEFKQAKPPSFKTSIISNPIKPYENLSRVHTKRLMSLLTPYIQKVPYPKTLKKLVTNTSCL